MIKKLFAIVSLFFLLSNNCCALEEVKIQEKLRLVDCIKIAIANNPKIKNAEQKLLIAKNNVSIAKSDYFPTIEANLGYEQKFNSDIEYDDGSVTRHIPMIGAYLNQLIYNFGKTSSKIQMQKFHQIAAEYEYLDSFCNTINEVKIKYCAVLNAIAVVKIAEENIKNDKKSISK